ncbi:antibiotic biosynthesis monooxygenase [Ammonicoccus fulvus]|uniref:Antibiotic biosynthesis monooxygenase n=1 Tax=Ammonicoccus fulvus TaxID=3138240 RepID=A0ABZ3FKC0_9ACTN
MSGPIRVLHHLGSGGDAAAIVQVTQAVREADGCLESEAYRGVSNGEVVVVELWADEVAFSRNWAERFRAADRDVVCAQVSGGELASDIAPHRTFRRDVIWIDNAASAESTVVWPSHGPVRVIVMATHGEPDLGAADFLVDEAATRREPGLQAYSWGQSLEHAHHFCLTELWDDQAIYDAHWNLRIKVARGQEEHGETPAARPPVERSQGANGVEFYRYVGFRHQYDRWLPVGLENWSETITWSA